MCVCVCVRESVCDRVCAGMDQGLNSAVSNVIANDKASAGFVSCNGESIDTTQTSIQHAL